MYLISMWYLFWLSEISDLKYIYLTWKKCQIGIYYLVYAWKLNGFDFYFLWDSRFKLALNNEIWGNLICMKYRNSLLHKYFKIEFKHIMQHSFYIKRTIQIKLKNKLLFLKRMNINRLHIVMFYLKKKNFPLSSPPPPIFL